MSNCSPAIFTQAATRTILKTLDRVDARSPIAISESEVGVLEEIDLSREPK